MTRDEHRAEAARLAANAERAWGDGQVGDPSPWAAHLAQLALVHATLGTAVRPLVVHLPAETDFTGDDLNQFAEALKEALQ